MKLTASAVLLTSLAAGFSSAWGATVGPWAQCGGPGLPGGGDFQVNQCSPGYQCKRFDAWYWQCLPSNAPPGPSQKKPWDQCGGRSLAGGGGQDSPTYGCTDGYSCSRISEWYWQCAPNKNQQMNYYFQDGLFESYNGGPPSSGEQGAVDNYAQCGGKNLPGGADKAMYGCKPGYQCTRNNEYYWQCTPSNTPPGANEKGAYDQCGGKGLPNGQDAAMYKCTAGYQCSKINDYYWQCTPYQGPPQNPTQGPTQNPTQGPTGSPDKKIDNYGQCGGKSLPGGDDKAMYGCKAGYQCNKVNEWYWQCLPSNTPPGKDQKPAYGQCGGKSLPDGKDASMYGCVDGYKCSKINDWYWQCVPSSNYDPYSNPQNGAFLESYATNNFRSVPVRGENGYYGIDSDPYMKYVLANQAPDSFWHSYMNSASDAIDKAAGGLGTTATVLIVVGALIVLACVTLLTVLIIRGRRRRRAAAALASPLSPSTSPPNGGPYVKQTDNFKLNI